MENTVGFYQIKSIDVEEGRLELVNHEAEHRKTVFLNQRGELHVEFRPKSLSPWEMELYVFIFRKEQAATDLKIDQNVIVVEDHYEGTRAHWSTDTEDVKAKFIHY